MHQESNSARLIEESPMSLRQMVLVTLCILINGLDGVDVLSISFAAPGISGEWGLKGGRLGIVLSMELIGMALGSVALGFWQIALAAAPWCCGAFCSCLRGCCCRQCQ
jgi:hypothetical protein